MPTQTAAPTTPAATRADTLDRLEDEMSILLRRIRRVLADRARTTHPDISVPGYLIMQRLHRTGPGRSSDLVEEFGVDKGAISRQVQQLVDLGMVSREADPDDGRAQQLRISDLGIERLTSTHEARRALLESRLGGWDDTELAGFVDGLTHYNAQLDASADAPIVG